ncbi:MAG: multidrug effflux MFS transporter [Marinosulfonomonas sp.]
MHSEPTVRFLDRTTPPHILTLILVSAMSALVTNMFLPSLPAMTVYFETEFSIIQLSVALFLTMNAVLQLIVGPLSDRYGRRPVLLGGFGVYLLATLGCIYAPSIEIFLMFRVAQASVVVAMVLTRTIVRDMVPQAQAASMIGYVTMGMAVVPMISPAIGGWLDESYGWHSVFWFLFAAGVLVIGLIWFDLGETNTHKSTSFGRQFKDYPELLASRRFWGYCLASAFASGAFFAYLGGAPFIGTDYFELPPSQLGMFFGTPAIGYMAGNFVTGRYSVRFGINKMILWGSGLMCLGIFAQVILFALGVGSVFSFFGFMVFMGFGNGMVLPNAASGLLSVRPHIAGTASGLGGAIAIGGGAALSILAGATLVPGSSPIPLLLIMLTSGIAAVLSIIYVIRRENTVGLA